jgi:hypothetical protein
LETIDVIVNDSFHAHYCSGQQNRRSKWPMATAGSL